MKLIPQLRDRGYLIDRVEFVNERGRKRSGFDAKILRHRLGNRFFSLPRGDLAEAIFQTVADKIETIFGDGIIAIREDPTGVDIQFENGHARRFDLVVGCDGLHSAVRKLVWGPEENFAKYPWLLLRFFHHDKLHTSRRGNLYRLCRTWATDQPVRFAWRAHGLFFHLCA